MKIELEQNANSKSSINMQYNDVWMGWNKMREFRNSDWAIKDWRRMIIEQQMKCKVDMGKEYIEVA